MIKRFPRAVPACVLPLLATACAASQPAWPVLPALESDERAEASWATLGPSDVVRVIVYGHPEASTAAEGERIDRQGKIALPLVGPLEVGGLTVDEARGRIHDGVARYVRDPKVAVSVLQSGAREFYLLGHVEEPGPKTLDRPLNALQALSYGGNLLRGAERERVLLFRRNTEGYDMYAFDADDPGPDGLVSIRTNDLIFVARSGSGAFYEEVLPFLQGAGFLAAVPVGIAALAD